MKVTRALSSTKSVRDLQRVFQFVGSARRRLDMGILKAQWECKQPFCTRRSPTWLDSFDVDTLNSSGVEEPLEFRSLWIHYQNPPTLPSAT